MSRRAHPDRYRVESLENRLLLSTVPSGFTETLINSSLTTPTSMAFAPDGRLFISQQTGEVKLVKNGAVVGTNVVTVNEDSNSERGLLGIALDPKFGDGSGNDWLYLYYTAASPTSHNRLSRFKISGDVATGGEQILDEFPDIGGAIYHMGGSIKFGFDGKLYVSVGEYDNPSYAQSLNVVMGKILRFNSDGSIPTDNPFFSQTTGVNKSIWAMGLRNPFTTAWDKAANRFFINDVGENSWEEINQGAAGANYGWPTTEGDFTQSSFPNFTRPIYTYSHGAARCVIGGAFYDSVSLTFPAQYQNKYFFGDFAAGYIKYMDPTTHAVSSFATGAGWITGISLAPDGALWYVSRGSELGGAGIGQVYRIQSNTAQGPQIALQPQPQTIPIGEPVTFSVSATGSSPFTYQWQRNNQNISGATSSSYTINSVQPSDNNAMFRCIVTNSVGNATSNNATLTVTNNTRPVPTILTPILGTTYGGGQLISYSGSASDTQDGVLPASAFTWEVLLHHDEHTHPFIQATTGSRTGSFNIPTTGETSPNVYYHIILTVTDSGGLTQTTTRDIVPRLANLTLATNVAGLSLNLDSQPLAAVPSIISGAEGLTRTLDAPATQTVGNITYQFLGWSDGGAQTHTMAFPSADQTVTAYYKKVPQTTQYVSDLNWVGTPTNGYGPVEKDRSNGENGAADGHTITLNGVTYAKGLGAHANSTITYDLTGGGYTRFMSDVGVDDEAAGAASIVFQVFNGSTNAKLYDSGTMNGSTATKAIDVSVVGITSLKLVITDSGNGNTDDHGDWAGARLISSGSAAPLTLTGTSGNDGWTLRMNANGTSVDVWNSATAAGNPNQTVAISAIDSIVVNGLAGDDTLVIDASNGAFPGLGQISFDGGANGADGDLLRILGSSAADTFDVSSGGVFIAALPISYVNAEALRIESTGAADAVNLNQLPGAAFAFDGGAGVNTLAYRGGTHSIAADLGLISAGVNVMVANSAALNFNSPQHFGTVTLSGTARLNMLAGGANLLRTTGVTIGGIATLDLNDNDMIVDYTGSSPLASIQSAINSARNGGAFDGFGLTSSSAKNITPKSTTLAAMTSIDFKSVYGDSATFDGEPLAGTAVLIKYTYYGDATFNGKVDGADYGRIDAAFNKERTAGNIGGWLNGDFNADGKVDGADFGLIDGAFNAQAGVL